MKAVVVAHPDDEALWLSSALAGADRVVFCFGDQLGGGKKSEARRRAVAALNLPGLVNLGLEESGVRQAVDWHAAVLTPAGMAITEAAGAARYEKNFAALCVALRIKLAGCTEIYTHNPWGEYGHAEHVQVYRAVAALQAELGYTIWFSNYVAPLSWELARRIGTAPCFARRQMTRPNRGRALKLLWIYLTRGAWTWPLTHRWPAQEIFYAQPPGDEPRQRLTGERLLDVSQLRWGRFGPAERVLD